MKTVKFANPKYVGDPINAVRIFNEKEVDELILLDIGASREQREPSYQQIEEIVSEAFMPIAYGGGVGTVEQARRIVSLGVEKIVLNYSVLQDYGLIGQLAAQLGSSSTVVSIDVKRDWRGRHHVYDRVSEKILTIDLVTYARRAWQAGAGEIFLNDVDRDGTGKGFDLDLVRNVSAAVEAPVIACGGAGKLQDFRLAADAGASAVAAGSLFVYVGKHRAVMITYPSYTTLVELFKGSVQLA
jgi:cyclase